MLDFGVVIKISGPGLIVNGPTAVIYKALTDAGYICELPSFAGQNDSVDKWPDGELKLLPLDKPQKITMSVSPLPWGG